MYPVWTIETKLPSADSRLFFKDEPKEVRLLVKFYRKRKRAVVYSLVDPILDDPAPAPPVRKN